ncbi:MAG: GNAT family N-acetyltransferase [Candidatus Heimdallarchaeota archaeon]
MESGIRAVKWYEFSKFKKSLSKNLHAADPTMSQANFFFKFLMYIWYRIKPENYFYIKDGKIAGILSLGTNYDKQVFTYAVAVEPSFRKQGIGKALMNFAEERTAELKKKYLALVVLVSNLSAVSLYQKIGYKRVGIGSTYLTIIADEIQTNNNYSLELRNYNVNENDLMVILKQFVFEETEAISGKEGLEYFEEISFPGYYPEVSKAIQKGKRFIYSIHNKEALIGFLLFSDKKNIRNVTIFSKVDTWNSDFLYALANVMIKVQNSSKKINLLNIRLSISKLERMKNIDQTDFKSDISKSKLLMFKKLE